MADNSLINFGDISKPATVLIEKISDAVGAIYRPHQIKRVAEAEADADRTRAVANLQISDMQRRAMHRMLQEEEAKQKNMESITEKAIPEVSENAKPEEIEKDWITNFFDKCRLTSDEEIQKLWAAILAGEANSPGAYSKKTVNLLSSLDKKDAELFRKLMGFGWAIAGVTPLIFEIKDTIYKNNGLNFIDLKHLDDIGLISFNHTGGFNNNGLPKVSAVMYYGRLTVLEFAKDADNSLDLGHVLLSQAGLELANVCGGSPVVGFEAYVRGKWKAKGIKIKNEEGA